MARANRQHIPGQVWRITHRCHKREYPLKFASDRERWLHWLFEAKKRFGLIVLGYIATSNHIHLLVQDHKNDVIARRPSTERTGRASRNGQRPLPSAPKDFVIGVLAQLGVRARGRGQASWRALGAAGTGHRLGDRFFRLRLARLASTTASYGKKLQTKVLVSVFRP